MKVSRVLWPMFALLSLVSCSSPGELTDEAAPEACDFSLPHRCDVCATGETVCAHYVIRDGVCRAETCPPSPSLPDASVPGTDASLPDASVPSPDAGPDSGGVVQVGPTYDCGPADAGLRCTCSADPFSPAPIDEKGQQQTLVLPPDPAAVVPYGTMEEFDALGVGRWRRTAGQGELVCEQYGVELTADHRLIPLVIASDGSVQAVTALGRSFTISGKSLLMPGLQTNAPVFFDSGRSMYFLYSPWPANYVRAP